MLKEKKENVLEDGRGKEMPWEGEKGDGGGRFGWCFSSLCACKSAIGGMDEAVEA